ncbi:MAG TPA: cupin domain-containing protein [Candidatus Sulfotelmatobacter sp.]|jgi:quercetin dioxygenase-like cupin family protein
MPMHRAFLSVIAILGCAGAPEPSAPKPQASNAARLTPLILEKDEGEHRVVRGCPGHPDPGETFILKIDPKNGGSSHLVLLTASIPARKKIDTHRHPEADEILFLQNGTARVHLGDTVREVHAGASVFIPAGTWISADNLGSDAFNLVAIFSAPGFEDFMRETSAGEGEKNIPLSQAEEDAVEKKHAHAVIYQ